MTPDTKRALRVGALALVSLAILVAILVVTGPLHIVRGSDVDVDFAFAGPIKPGASVRISGVVVGAVTSVDLLAGQDASAGPDKMVRVHARIEERAMRVLSERAIFRVTTLGILGEHYLDVEPVAGGALLASGARVNGVSGARPDLLLSRAAGLLEKADALLPNSPEALELMRSTASLMKRLDALLANDSPADADVKAVATDLRALLHGAAVGVGDGTAIKSTFEKLPRTLDGATHTFSKFDDVDIAATCAELRATLTEARAAMALLEKQPLADPVKQEQLRADLEATLRSLTATMVRADRLLGAVEDKKGAAGTLSWDERAAHDLSDLLHGIRSDPVKLLLGGKPSP